jgi:hypothetical protein
MLPREDLGIAGRLGLENLQLEGIGWFGDREKRRDDRMVMCCRRSVTLYLRLLSMLPKAWLPRTIKQMVGVDHINRSLAEMRVFTVCAFGSC